MGRMAASGSNHFPPSEKESGVTLTTPMTSVRPGWGRPATRMRASSGPPYAHGRVATTARDQRLGHSCCSRRSRCARTRNRASGTGARGPAGRSGGARPPRSLRTRSPVDRDRSRGSEPTWLILVRESDRVRLDQTWSRRDVTPDGCSKTGPIASSCGFVTARTRRPRRAAATQTRQLYLPRPASARVPARCSVTVGGDSPDGFRPRGAEDQDLLQDAVEPTPCGKLGQPVAPAVLLLWPAKPSTWPLAGDDGSEASPLPTLGYVWACSRTSSGITCRPRPRMLGSTGSATPVPRASAASC